MKPPRRPSSDTGSRSGPRSGAPSSGAPRSGPPRSGPPRSGPPRSGPPRSGGPGAGGRNASERGASERGASDRGASDRGASDRAPSNRGTSERGPSDRTPPTGGRGRAPDRSSGPRPATPRPQEPRAERRTSPSRVPAERAQSERRLPERAPPEPAPETTLRARERPEARPDSPRRPRTERLPQGTREGPREAPGNSLWLYGIHAVAAAMANPARHLRRLLLTEEAEAAIATRLPRPWALSPERTDRARIDYLLGAGAIHQGAALLVEPLAPPSLQSAVARPGTILVLDQVTDPRNVGAILRAAAALGVAAVITQDRNAPEETGALAKAASGALETVPFLRAVNIARTLVALRAAGFWVIGLDAGGSPLSGPALAERRVALVLGSEGEGLRRLTREPCDETAAIVMPGASTLLDSLNVATAAAIALYELARR